MIISQIVLTSTDNTETIVLNEYDNFKDVEIVLELNEDDYHYYANINNVKVFYPVAQQLINSLKSYKVDVYIDSFVFNGYLTFDDIQIVHDEYVILNIQMNTHNKLILDLYSTIVDSNDNIIKLTYAILNTADSYPRSAILATMFEHFIYEYNELLHIIEDSYSDYAEIMNPITIGNAVVKKAARIIVNLTRIGRVRAQSLIIFKKLKGYIKTLYQEYNYVQLKKLVEKILEKNGINDYDLSFIEDDLYILTSNSYYLARDVFDFIKKYYNVYINVYETNNNRHIRFIKATQNNYTQLSYNKIKKRDSYMLKNVLIVKFNVDVTNTYSIRNLFFEFNDTENRVKVKNIYEKIIDSASSSLRINIDYSLYSIYFKHDFFHTAIITFFILIITVIPILVSLAFYFSSLAANLFYLSNCVVALYNIADIISIMLNYKIKKNILIVSNITSSDFVVRVKEIRETKIFKKQFDELILTSSLSVLQKLKDTYQDTYYRYIYNEKTYMSFQDFLQLIANPGNIKSVRYKVYDELLQGEIYENVLANVQYVDRFV